MIAYKLTDQNMQTYGGYQWELGEWLTTTGHGNLCTSGWIHFYESQYLGLFLNPIHANFNNPRLFECEVEGQIKRDRGLKAGCTRLRLTKELSVPAISIQQRMAFVIFVGLEVWTDSAWLSWSDKWLSGEDRTHVVAYARDDTYIYTDAAIVAYAATCVAYDYYPNTIAVAYVADAITYAVDAYIAAATTWNIDLEALAVKAIEWEDPLNT